MTLTPVSVGTAAAANIAVPSATFARATFSNQERVTVTAGVSSRGGQAATNVPVSLEIDGHPIESKSVTVAPNASASVTFAPFTLSEPQVHGLIKAGSDAFPADNTFDFVMTPSQQVSILIVDSGAAGGASFYLTKALSIGNTPAFQLETIPAARVTPQMLDKRSVVILNDTMLPPGLSGDALKRYVERGGGLLVAFGDHSSWPTTETDLLPGRLGAVVDRTDGRGATIGFRDYSHQVFEVFKAPRSGDFSAVRVLRYRAIEPGPPDRGISSYHNGAVAAVEKRVGAGRVMAWTTTLDDSWTDLALRPVYLPLVHQFMRYLSQYEQTSYWSTVGQVIDLSAAFKAKADRIVMTPSGDRVRMGASDSGILELNEHGLYEVRSAANGSGRPDRIAVNLDPAESDLTPLDPSELVAAVTGRATPTAVTSTEKPAELTAEEAERRQGVWWYLLAAGLILLAAETAVANQLSRSGERFT